MQSTIIAGSFPSTAVARNGVQQTDPQSPSSRSEKVTSTARTTLTQEPTPLPFSRKRQVVEISSSDRSTSSSTSVSGSTDSVTQASHQAPEAVQAPSEKKQKTLSEAELVEIKKNTIERKFSDWSANFHPKAGFWTSLLKTEDQIQAIYADTKGKFLKKLNDAKTKQELIWALSKNRQVLTNFKDNVDGPTEKALDRAIAMIEEELKALGEKL